MTKDLNLNTKLIEDSKQIFGGGQKVHLILEHIHQVNMDKIKKVSPDYGIQLQAKQKLKAYYGNINERQFRNIYRKALSKEEIQPKT